MRDPTATAVTAHNIVTYLQHRPLAYRSYGAYWWAVKAFLKASGHMMDLGITRPYFPDGWQKMYGEGVTLQEALQYSADANRSGRTADVLHTTPNEDAEQHYLHDPDME